MVNKIIGERGSGKTKQLLEFASKNDCTVVCENVERMTEKAHAYGIIGLRIINYTEFWALEDQLNIGGYCIDDFESCCEVMNVKAFTLVD